MLSPECSDCSVRQMGSAAVSALMALDETMANYRSSLAVKAASGRIDQGIKMVDCPQCRAHRALALSAISTFSLSAA